MLFYNSAYNTLFISAFTGGFKARFAHFKPCAVTYKVTGIEMDKRAV